MGRLFLVLALVALSWRDSDSCPSGYRPLSCTACIAINEDELPFSETDCSLIDFALLMNESLVLRRYLEVFNMQQLWIGYGEANTSQTLGLPVIGNETCDSCCLAWQLKPYGLVRVDCEKELAGICTVFRSDADTINRESSGLGQSDYVSLYVEGVLQPDAQIHYIRFGSTIALNCSNDNGVKVKWYLNNEEAEIESSILELQFQQSGTYRCELVSNEMEKENSSVLLCGVDAEPGDVRRLSASALSQTELNVTWSPPEPLATSDPLLLRYTLYYSSLDVLNEKSERLMSVIPQLPDGSVEVELSDLSIGTKYTIGVVAISTMIPVALKYPTLNIVVSTYGKAPISRVFGLTLQQWEDDDKALLASWETAQLSSSEGPISFYEVEYRDGEQGLSNRVYVPPDPPFFIIYGVENGDNYEVRVAILVEVSPRTHNRSQWTDWVGVNSTKSEGEVQQTTEKGEVKPMDNKGDAADVEVILAAVLLPLTVLLISALLFSTCLCFCCRRSKQSYSVQKEEFTDSVETKNVTSTDV